MKPTQDPNDTSGSEESSDDEDNPYFRHLNNLLLQAMKAQVESGKLENLILQDEKVAKDPTTLRKIQGMLSTMRQYANRWLFSSSEAYNLKNSWSKLENEKFVELTTALNKYVEGGLVQMRSMHDNYVLTYCNGAGTSNVPSSERAQTESPKTSATFFRPHFNDQVKDTTKDVHQQRAASTGILDETRRRPHLQEMEEVIKRVDERNKSVTGLTLPAKKGARNDVRVLPLTSPFCARNRLQNDPAGWRFQSSEPTEAVHQPSHSSRTTGPPFPKPLSPVVKILTSHAASSSRTNRRTSASPEKRGRTRRRGHRTSSSESSSQGGTFAGGRHAQESASERKKNMSQRSTAGERKSHNDKKSTSRNLSHTEPKKVIRRLSAIPDVRDFNDSDPSSDPTSSSSDSSSESEHHRRDHGRANRRGERRRRTHTHRRGRRGRRGRRSSSGEDDIDEYPPDRWYREVLPHPWNVAPKQKRGNVNKIVNYHKIDLFDGKNNFFDWRNKVLVCVHKAPGKISDKMCAMVKLLDLSSRRLYGIVPKDEYAPPTYAKLIIDLEDRFGGSDRLLNELSQEVTDHQDVIVGNVESLSTMISALFRYLKAQDELGDNSDGRILFRGVYKKLPRQYRLEYGRWIALHSKPSRSGLRSAKQVDDQMNTSNLLEWMETHLSILRREATICDVEREKMSNAAGKGNKPKNSLPQKRTGSLSDESQEQSLNGSGTPPKRDCEDSEAEEYHYDSDTGHGYFITEEGNKGCQVCQQEHVIKRCPKFLMMTPKWRRDFIVEKRLKVCLNCLGPHHKCPTPQPCPVDAEGGKCGRKHNRLIHGSDKYHIQAMGVKNASGNHQASTTHGRISLRTVPLRFTNRETKMSVVHNALLDDGSENTMMSNKIQRQLDLQGKLSTCRVTGIGGKAITCSMLATFDVETLDGSFKTTMEAWVVPEPLSLVRATSWKLYQDNWDHLKDINFPDLPNDTVEVLIGGQHADLIASLREVIGQPGDPVARLCKLGWTALGPLTPEDKERKYHDKTATSMSTTVEKHLPESLNDLDDDHQVSSLNDINVHLSASRLALDAISGSRDADRASDTPAKDEASDAPEDEIFAALYPTTDLGLLDDRGGAGGGGGRHDDRARARDADRGFKGRKTNRRIRRSTDSATELSACWCCGLKEHNNLAEAATAAAANNTAATSIITPPLKSTESPDAHNLCATPLCIPNDSNLPASDVNISASAATRGLEGSNSAKETRFPSRCSRRNSARRTTRRRWTPRFSASSTAPTSPAQQWTTTSTSSATSSLASPASTPPSTPLARRTHHAQRTHQARRSPTSPAWGSSTSSASPAFVPIASAPPAWRWTSAAPPAWSWTSSPPVWCWTSALPAPPASALPAWRWTSAAPSAWCWTSTPLAWCWTSAFPAWSWTSTPPAWCWT